MNLRLIMSNLDKTDSNQDSRIQTKFNYQEIQDHIDTIELIFNKSLENYQNISAEELVNYFKEPAPSGDLTDLSDILDNKWLLIHELVELSELKGMNLKITAQLLRTHPTEVDYAHITATEYELKFAKKGNDNIWITSRLKDIFSWGEDDLMPNDLKLRCHKLVKEYSI